MMAKFTVQLVESRDIVYHVEADNADEAQQIAMDMETDDAVRDGYRSREHDWTASGHI